MQYFIPKSAVVFEEEIKKSRFMTYLRHTQGLSQAKAFWEQVRVLHPQARHHCWAPLNRTLSRIKPALRGWMSRLLPYMPKD